MKYSPAYIMDITGVQQETLRHWRKVLPPLTKRRGGKCFSTGDILALLIIKDITSTFNIQVKGLVPFAVQIFEACNVLNWSNYQNRFMSLNFSNESIEFITFGASISELTAPLLLIDVEKHIVHVKSKLLDDTSAEQIEMYFPPRRVVPRRAA